MEGIRKIFKLDEEEMIYDSFQCTIKTSNLPGVLYITENYLCFYSTVGININYSKLIFHSYIIGSCIVILLESLKVELNEIKQVKNKQSNSVTIILNNDDEIVFRSQDPRIEVMKNLIFSIVKGGDDINEENSVEEIDNIDEIEKNETRERSMTD